MIALAQVRKSQLRVASHYVKLVCRCNADYLSGFERSLKALQVFDQERLQIENTTAWLMRQTEDDEAGTLLVTLLRDGNQLLYARIDAAKLQMWLEYGLDVARRLGDVRSQAAQLLVIGYTVWRMSNLEPSRAYFEQAYALAQQTDDQHLLIRCLQALVKLHATEREYDAAARCNQQAYDLSCRLRFTPGMYAYFDHRSTQFYDEGQFVEALTALNQAYTLALKAGLYREIALTLTTMGMIYHLQERFEDAITTLRQASEFSLRTDYPPVILYTLYALGNAQAAVREIAAARETFLTALRLAEHHHIDEQAGALRGELGVLAFQQHDLPLARQYLENALDQLRSVGATFYYLPFLSQLVPIYLAMGDAASAEHALRESLDFAMRMPAPQHSLNVVWEAAQIWIHRAERDHLTPEQQSEWAARGASWAGAALASPNLLPNDRDILHSLIPNLQAALGVEHTAELLADGAQLDPDSLIDGVGAALAAQ